MWLTITILHHFIGPQPTKPNCSTIQQSMYSDTLKTSILRQIHGPFWRPPFRFVELDDAFINVLLMRLQKCCYPM